jgi:hypothetical protein
MKTYINDRKKVCTLKPERFEVGVDILGISIYNDDLVYYCSDYAGTVRQLDKNYEGYGINSFNNAIKIYKHQVPELLTYLVRLFNKQLYQTINYIPEIGSIVILRSHNYEYKVLDNKGKLFIKLQSIGNPAIIQIHGVWELNQK